MKKVCVLLLLAFSVNLNASELVLLDCDITTNDGTGFTFMELDWDKDAETADISYYDMNGNNKGSYTNIPVSSSPKTINFKSGMNLLDDQPTQFAEGQISRVDMSFVVGVSTPLWRDNMGSNLLDVDGKCRKSDRKLEQAF
ncbi:hypothetical protein OAT01_04970 [Pseudomonadales bacterium]|nr:hypothetical protein [Pseudomonadales bacterium]